MRARHTANGKFLAVYKRKGSPESVERGENNTASAPTRDFPGPRCTGGPVAERRDGSGRGPGGAPRDSMSFRMSHIEAKSINIWLRYDP